jgi:AcrR family transcriptional regulator
MDETRRRIAKAGFELHALVGPSAASISAIADRAGVQRHTLYRHFPDMASLIRACTDHGMALFPPPDPEPWLRIADPLDRLRTGLREVYEYYRENERLLANISRDIQVMPALMQGAESWIRHMGRIHEALSSGWRLRGRRRDLVMAAVGHATDFGAWQSLERQGLDEDGAAEAMVTMVRCLSSRSHG